MSQGSFFKVRINTMVPGKPTTFDLHIKINGQNILYLRAGDRLQPEKIKSLDSKDTGSFFLVKEEDRKAYKQYVHEQMISDDLNVREKALVLRESSMTLVEELFEQPDVHSALDHSKPLIKDFVEFMRAEPEAMGHLISLSGHDFYTYNHSLDVGIYSLGLGEALSYGKKELEELGIAALFHDVGKRHVSLDILCKKGPLNDAEWAQMQKHPQFGLAILNENPTVTDAVKAACFEHHESWAGNGYPQQLSGQEIHPFARIVAITDTYDAMTTQRSYNVPLKPVDAVTTMRDKLAGRYDPEILRAMYSVLFKLKAA
ncbi:MAG: HD-GYP domain-containing protein [Proteobacteria bacterium]|jgi:HD-GYP domain-containing protein (c-di-GMP phosphodiesterase class II)|nr:HD-GYP domain-containing protein [Pseudomonadota bacterium]